MFIVIGSLNINRKKDQTAAIILNDIILVLIFIISLVNVIISGFGIEYSSQPLHLLEREHYWNDEPIRTFLLNYRFTRNFRSELKLSAALYQVKSNNKAIFDSIANCFFIFVPRSIQVTAAVLAVVTSRLDLHESARQRTIANALTHISMGLVFVALFCDVVKMNFGLEPAVPYSDKKGL